MKDMKVNGEFYELAAPANRTLLEYVRRDLQLTGGKESCGTGDCGSCSMLVDGEVVKSCLVLAAECENSEITTVEGLASEGALHPIQEAFVKHWGTQCGYCTPGFVMATKALLDRNPNPTEEEIKHETAGNLCRCTGYVKIIDAVKEAAAVLQEKRG
ncbi:(2Fe-2S)-binding protein [Alkalihalobacillus oceani]|uniref:(2Fe-2S)-binding protein n=1 Tax=Halalkalibacter oceani TaxID=1653776 RepID=A0A9X2DTM6_9BACI|nr:(2Fe-2S)-binding protein [Halalkalibacter oceani]MCM3715920.1 (2Fe-2S)-binding protein [Halalkalibacter oceani]